MKTINEKLEKLKNELKNRKVRIMIIGLGSVGNYLLDYLVSMADENMEICVVGRNEEKIFSRNRNELRIRLCSTNRSWS